MEPTYKIVRHYLEAGKRVVKRGLTLKQAQKHCSSDQATSRKCTTPDGIRRTRKLGPWFDGYSAE